MSWHVVCVGVRCTLAFYRAQRDRERLVGLGTANTPSTGKSSNSSSSSSAAADFCGVGCSGFASAAAAALSAGLSVGAAIISVESVGSDVKTVAWTVTDGDSDWWSATK